MKKGFALFLALCLALGTIPALAEGEFAQKLEGMYKEVEVEYRPDVRWWLAEGLNTDDTLTRNVQQIYDSGFGAAEFLAMPENGADSTVYGWGSEEWTADSQLVVNKAAELGLGFSLTSGTHWANANLPDTYVWNDQPFDGDNIAASKELDYALITLEAGESFDGELPLPPHTMGGGWGAPPTPKAYSEHLFQGVVAAKVVTPREGAGVEYAEGSGIGALDMASLQLLEAIEGEDGSVTLNWTAPDDGQYALFAFWMHGSGQTADPSVSVNFTVNYMDSYGIEAMIDYWNEYILTDDLRQTLQNSGRGEIYMDSLEVDTYGQGGLFWGYHFKEEFESRMGYDITPYLPLIVAADGRQQGGSFKIYDYQPADEADLNVASKVRADYYRVMTDMYVEHVLEPLQTWLHSLNMTLRAEPSYGFNFEISTPAAYIDDIETESFAQNADIDLYRGLLGSANMYGRLFSSETGAVGGHNYFYNMDAWTNLCYLQFVNGINRTVFHGYSAIEGSDGSTYWPGHEGMYSFFSERFNERQPASEMYPAWTAMLSRNQKALRQGAPARDIAILRSDYFFINYGFANGWDNFTRNYQMHDTPYYWSDLELQHNGYTYDYFSPLVLTDEQNVTWTAEALQPDGPAYKAIIVYQEEIELEGAQALLKVAQAGLPVVFVNNNTEVLAHDGTVAEHHEAASRSRHMSASDEEVQAVVAEIKALPNVKTVDSPADAMEALQELGVYPRVAFAEENDKILTISRQDDENGIYYTFVYSFKFELDKGEEPYAVTLSFEKAGKPYMIDDWTGKVAEIPAYEIADGRTCVTLSLVPGQAALIAIDESDDGSGLHAVSTTADALILRDGLLFAAATSAGTYETVLSTGETVTTEVESVPEAIALPTWDITIEDWNEGDKVVNTEEKFGHVTEEVYYTTKKTELSFPQSALVAWKDLPATEEQLATLSGDAPSMAHVSGIGTYTTAFDVPDEWMGMGALLKVTSTGGGLAEVTVNGQAAGMIDLRELSLDISDYITPGQTNTITIRVASTLTNRMLQRDYGAGAGWGTEEAASDGNPFGSADVVRVQDYGLQGEVSIVPCLIQNIG